MIASPVNLGIQSAAVSADPVTGNFVVISSGSSTIRIFNPDGNGSWSVAGGTLPSALQWTKGSGDEPQEVPITNYNGIMWMKFNGSTVSYIYKASTSSDTTAPTAPSGLTVNAISASQIDLSWTASTDAVGVTGYNVERCALAGCVNFVEVYQPGAVSQSDTGLTAATLYRYRVRAHDAAGNLSGYSAIAQATTQSGGVSADQDFINRRTSPGVIRWFGFDDNSALPRASPGNNEDWGHDFGVMPSGAGALPTIGTSVKASGAGALHYVQAVGSSSGSAGSWFTHFGVNKTGQIGAGERIFVQFRVRWSPEMLVNSNWPGSGGAKIMDISLGDLPSCVPGDSSTCPTSCPNQGFEFVIQNNQARGIPTAYANCHNPAAFVEMAASTVPPGGVNPQNMVSGCTDANALGTCVPFVANEWMTFQVMLQVGTWGTFSSPVKVWFAREGQPSTLIIDCESGVTPSCTRDFAGASNGWVFVNDDPANFKMGKVYLHPYQTGMSGALASATIDYDELIISTQQIPDPGAAAVAISAPSSIRVTNRY
jgi:chitodextrinase